MNQVKQRGFTIVELLIVIVVIGILAAITIVAYNGIQQRALNTKVANGVNEYRKALLSYHALNGQYPSSVSSCLGMNYPENQCWKGDSGNIYVDSAFDTELNQIIKNKPELASKRFSIGVTDNMRAGAVYRILSGRSQITYYLQGVGQKCPYGSGGTEGGVVTQCNYVLPNQ